MPRQTCCAAVVASVITATGVRRDQPASIKRQAIPTERPSPIGPHQGDSIRRYSQRRRSERRFVMRRHDEKSGRHTAMRDRNARRRRCGDSARNAGHDVVRDASALQGERFFAAATEDERVAALQP